MWSGDNVLLPTLRTLSLLTLSSTNSQLWWQKSTDFSLMRRRNRIPTPSSTQNGSLISLSCSFHTRVAGRAIPSPSRSDALAPASAGQASNLLRVPPPFSPGACAAQGRLLRRGGAARLAAGAEWGERCAGGGGGWAEGTRGRRRRHVARPQPRRGRLSLCRRAGGAARTARPGLRPLPAHRPGAAAVPQRESGGQRPRCLQAVGGADRPLQGGPFGAWGGRARRGPARGLPSALSASVLLLKITTARLPSAFPCPSPVLPLGRKQGRVSPFCR